MKYLQLGTVKPFSPLSLQVVTQIRGPIRAGSLPPFPPQFVPCTFIPKICLPFLLASNCSCRQQKRRLNKRTTPKLHPAYPVSTLVLLPREVPGIYWYTGIYYSYCSYGVWPQRKYTANKRKSAHQNPNVLGTKQHTTSEQNTK